MRKLLVIAGAVCAMSTTAPAAFAASTGDQAVTGATLSSLALGVSTPAVALGGFAPGSTATGAGALIVTSTNPWTLKAADGTGNAGHLAAAALGCTGSEPTTVNPLVVATSGGGSTTSAGPVAVSGTSVAVANGLFADVITTSYSLPLGNTEALLTGCVYTTTVTYTVQ